MYILDSNIYYEPIQGLFFSDPSETENDNDESDATHDEEEDSNEESEDESDYETEDESDYETEDEDETDENPFTELVQEDADLLPEYDKIITVVRKIVNKFRRSRVKNDVLQKYMKNSFGRKLKLILDCKTRWTSLRAMLNRFIKCIDEIKKAMKDFNIAFELSDKQVQDLKDMCNALEPFEVAVKALCRRDATLLTAEKTIEFTIGVLEKMENNISQQLLEVKNCGMY